MDFPSDLGTVDGRFVDEDRDEGVRGSTVVAGWGNAITYEAINLIRAAGLVPDEHNVGQMAEAVQILISRSGNGGGNNGGGDGENGSGSPGVLEVVQRVVAAGQATVPFFFDTSADFDAYEIDLSAIQTDSAGSDTLAVQFSLDGVTWRTDNFYSLTTGAFIGQMNTGPGTPAASSATSQTNIIIAGGLVSGNVLNANVTIPNFAEAPGASRLMSAIYAGILSDGVLRVGQTSGGYFGAAGAIRGVRFLWANGSAFAGDSLITLMGKRTTVGSGAGSGSGGGPGDGSGGGGPGDIIINASDYVLIETQEANGALHVFSIPEEFEQVELRFHSLLPNADGFPIAVQFSDDGGVSWFDSATPPYMHSTMFGFSDPAMTVPVNDGLRTHGSLRIINGSTDVGGGPRWAQYDGVIRFFNVNTASVCPSATWEILAMGWNADIAALAGGGRLLHIGSRKNAIRIFLVGSGGQGFSRGTFSLYGVVTDPAKHPAIPRPIVIDPSLTVLDDVEAAGKGVVEFIFPQSSEYRSFDIDLLTLQSSGAVGDALRVQYTHDGVNWTATNQYRWVIGANVAGSGPNGTVTAGTAHDDSAITLCGGLGGATSINARMSMQDVTNNTVGKTIFGTYVAVLADAALRNGTTSGEWYGNAQPVRGVRFFWSNGSTFVNTSRLILYARRTPDPQRLPNVVPIENGGTGKTSRIAAAKALGVGRVLLDVKEFSNDQTIPTFRGLTDFDVYELVFDGLLPVVDNLALAMQFSNDNGATFIDSDYQHTIVFSYSDGRGPSNDASWGPLSVMRLYGGLRNVGGAPLFAQYSGRVHLHNFRRTDVCPSAIWEAEGIAGDTSAACHLTGSGRLLNLTGHPINCFRLWPMPGGGISFQRGKMMLYGLTSELE